MIIEYFKENLWQMWTAAFFVLLILEVFSGDFFIMSFAIGALASVLAAACGMSFTVQVIVFACVSVLTLFFVRPAALRYLHRNDDHRASNAEAVIGREGTVSEAIEAGGYGRVAIDGDDWKARTADGSPIDKGVRVRVTAMESIIITVTPA